jgi:O-antigen ligase
LRAKSPRREFEDVISYGLIAGLAICPFWFGSNRLGAWGFNAIVFSSLVIALEISLILRAKSHPVPIRQILLPAIGIGIVLAWIWLQMSSFTPSAWHYPIWSMAADALNTPLEGSISVSPDLTLLALIRLLTAAAVFWLALQLGREPRRAMRILLFIGIIGALYSAYGTISFIANPDSLLWFPKTAYRESVTSTFVNRNNFATYAGVTLVTCIGVAASLLNREVESAGGRARARISAAAAVLAERGGYLLVCIFVISIALIMTGSRAGITATIAGIAVLALVSSNRRSITSAAGIVLGLAALAVISAVVGFGDLFVERLSGMNPLQDARVNAYKLVIQSILDAPIRGFGYGSFADVFPLYRDGSLGINKIWDKAHNTYLEVAQGLGIPIAVLLFASVGLLVGRCFKGSWERRRHSTACFIATAASAIVLLHALLDFSLQIQAVTLTWCAILGSGVAQSFRTGFGREAPHQIATRDLRHQPDSWAGSSTIMSLPSGR